MSVCVWRGWACGYWPKLEPNCPTPVQFNSTATKTMAMDHGGKSHAPIIVRLGESHLCDRGAAEGIGVACFGIDTCHRPTRSSAQQQEPVCSVHCSRKHFVPFGCRCRRCAAASTRPCSKCTQRANRNSMTAVVPRRMRRMALLGPTASLFKVIFAKGLRSQRASESPAIRAC